MREMRYNINMKRGREKGTIEKNQRDRERVERERNSLEESERYRESEMKMSFVHNCAFKGFIVKRKRKRRQISLK